MRIFPEGGRLAPALLLSGSVQTAHLADPVACAAFLIVALSGAGVAQTAWFKSRRSARLAIPLDGGRTLFGRPIFGPNKTWKGFAVMVPASGLSFLVLSVLALRAPAMGQRLWALTPWQYGGLGVIAGIGFMAGELPNSFVKRQLGIPPGEPPRRVSNLTCLGPLLLTSIPPLVPSRHDVVFLPYVTASCPASPA